MSRPTVTAQAVAGQVRIIVSLGGGTLALTLPPDAAVEACGEICRAAADAEVWAEDVRDRIGRGVR